MKVAIVHDFIFKLGGAERVVAELIREGGKKVALDLGELGLY